MLNFFRLFIFPHGKENLNSLVCLNYKLVDLLFFTAIIFLSKLVYITDVKN